MDYYEEQDAEIDRLKIILDIKERELKAARTVVKAAYWWLAYNYQGALIDMAKPVDMNVFEPGLRDLMPNTDIYMFDALDEYAIAMGPPR